MPQSRRRILETSDLAQRIVEAALERKALDVVVIDVRGLSSYTDYLVITSGTSDRHVQSVAENVDTAIGHQGVHCIGREGVRQGQWALVDFGSVILHVFHQFTRTVFDLESMWREAPQQKIASASASLEVTPTPLWAPGF